jgi:outer membrane protein assembly factor BamB
VRIQTVWQQRTGSIFNERWVRLQPWRGEDILVTANIGGQVTARDPARGKRRWQRQLDGWIAAGVAGDDGLAYVGTREGVVVAFNLDDGSERWRRDVAGELLAQPAPSDDYVVVRTVDGRIIALERDDGARRWTYTSDVPSLSLRGNSRPVPVPGGVLVGLDNGRLVALQDRVGQPIWESEIQATTGDSPIARLADIDGSIGAGRSAIYAATYQGRLARVRPQDGTIGWSEELSSYAGLRLDGERLYVTEANSHVRAVDPDSGQTLWRQDKLAHRKLTAPVPIPDTDYLIVGDYNGYVHILTRADGRIVGRQRPGDSFGILADAVAVDANRVAIQTRGGQLSVLSIRARQ